MALRKFLILRKLRSSCLEGRRVPIQSVGDFLIPSCAGMTEAPSPVFLDSYSPSGAHELGEHQWSLWSNSVKSNSSATPAI
jgi:hypothetical protein